MRFRARRISHQRAFSQALGIVGSVEHRDQRIVAETDRHRITGILHLPRDGYRSRLTDYLNASEMAFLALTDVEITNLEGGERQRKPFLALALGHVVLVMPAEDE